MATGGVFGIDWHHYHLAGQASRSRARAFLASSSLESPQCAFEGFGLRGLIERPPRLLSECVFRCHLWHTFIRFISDTLDWYLGG